MTGRPNARQQLDNGHRLDASDAELVVAFLALAAGEYSEQELADWFRAHLQTA